MKNTKVFLLLILCCFFGSDIVLAQKAKFKNLTATCQKTRLPQNFVAPENRTYDLYKKGSYSMNVDVHDKGIYGWTLDRDNPKLEAAVSIYGFQINPAKRSSQKKEKKDKEGKVTDRWTEYTYSGSAEGKGTLYIYGESNRFVYQKKDAKPKKKSKAELKREEEAEAKKKALADNPFLSSEDVAEAGDEGESDISEDSGLDGALLPLADRVSLDITESVSTKAYRSSSAAYKDYKDNQKPKLYKFRSNYPTRAYDKAISTLNYQYGYSPIKYRVSLKKMKSEKHGEFKTWNDACMAIETLFKTFRYNKSIADSQSKFDPIIGYFNKQVESIADGDRKGKNLKKAAFSNLINTMYYLDRYEEVITLCNKYKDSKILDKASKRMLKKTDKQLALMAFHKLESCHLEELTDIDEGDIETSEEEEVDEEESNNK